jgi:hypothetical protein
MHPDHDYLYATQRAELDQRHRAAQRRRDHPPPRRERAAGRLRLSLARALRHAADRLAPAPGRSTSRA